MSELCSTPVDAVMELRLRRWARQNYVPADRRRETWHPVVLDEMHIRDEEQRIHSIRPAGLTAYVPLMPDNIRVHHGAHQGRPNPAIVRQLSPSEQQSCVGVWQW